MQIAVVIATYKRPDGRTPFYLMRALDSVKAQTYTDYKVFVIGDNYTDEKEFDGFKRKYPWAVFVNLEKAVERDKYPFGSMLLYCAGGCNAGNTGIEIALQEGCDYVCCLGHDDWWEKDHLSALTQIIEQYHPVFACTLSTYIRDYLPIVPITGRVMEFYPKPCGMVSASAIVNYADTKLRARDVYEETGTEFAADADLWQRLTEEMKNTGKKGYLFSRITCHHDEEGYSLRVQLK